MRLAEEGSVACHRTGEAGTARFSAAPSSERSPDGPDTKSARKA